MLVNWRETMAKENPPLDSTNQQPAPAPAPQASSGWSLQKILTIAVPVLILQVVLVYFLVAKFFAPKMAGEKDGGSAVASETKSSKDDETTQIVVIKDIIVNPAGTNGTRFLVTTVGLEVPTVEAKNELEQKEVQTRDVLITILAGKRLEDLATPENKDSLRAEIQRNIDKILRSAKLKNVYISKFIIQ